PHSSAGHSSQKTVTKTASSLQPPPGSPETALHNSSITLEEKLATLNQAPAHQQDRDAVRNAMNSFRDVANYSARMAIARHSLKHQKTDLIFKGILSGLCILFSLIIFGEAYWGSNSLGIFKWAALAVTIASTAQFLRGWKEARNLLSCPLPDEKEH
ncbi:MAG TPA: hypothetical protein DDZ90_19320, partial [Planctomycetaceae bacterium]|nr:hypothetical protein [Planctomycetaceae bacterium]